ncbi:47 kDa outer membrane protein [Pseudoalteromonas holothuriae]|uniref:47 kDa outer membrane protein n=1 Tax=Pseudoalteromonas holothuriae TaxID=2963714 RepID=A0A9W4R0Y3_9GAMM|nr:MULTISPECIES: outer membrane protein transport protein [unclassified Pseudoalteromonas]CAH9056638.1 47 kDa outer membrane protein [Pseudoalteromonas sp. CIP111951]CAH9063095.1 47 kDa outer membrane protein [Pseudoalteromonas sp. CIP111854]
MSVFKKTLVASSLMLVSSHAFAAAFQLAEQSVSGLGRAYAGEASVADDASVVARNPALMSQFESAQLSVAAMFVEPDVSLKGTTTNNGVDVSALDDSSIAPSAVVPAAYYTRPMGQGWYLGVGVYSQFGLATEFASDYAPGQIAGETEIVTVNTNVSVAYQISEEFTIALGISHVYADAKIIRNFGQSPLPIPAQTEAVHLEGDDQGYGWNLGLSYQLDKGNRLGFNYRSETDITFEGEFANQLPTGAPFYGTANEKSPGSVAITLPAIAEFSGSHQVNEQSALHFSLLWTQWSSFKTLAAKVDGRGTVFSKDENFSNSMRYAIGADHQYSDELTLRFGIAYDKSPADPYHMSISIPDTDRMWYSLGAEYQVSINSSLDVGVSFLRGKTQNFVEADNLGQVWGFESNGHATVLGVQYNLGF